MARSREEIISEMVDSGLFTDDEIRAEVGKTVKAWSDADTRQHPTSAAEGVSRFAKDSLELLPIPNSMDAAMRLINPIPGKFGPSRTLQDLGEAFPPVQEAVGGAADKLAESKIGQKFPIPTSAAGAGTYALSHLLPQKLTPSEAAFNIGAEGLNLGAKAAMIPLAKAGKAVARGAESISGLEYKTPGILEEAARDSRVLFRPGKETAKPMYEGLMEGAKVREAFGRATTPQQIIDEGLKALDDGSLTPQEALVARQAVDKVKSTLPAYSFNKMRDAFNSVAKKVTEAADTAYREGLRSDELRRLLPVNKSGGTSIAKSTLGSIAGLLPLGMMSPVVQGAVATSAGAAGRQLAGKAIPGIRAVLMNALESRRRSNAKKGL